MLARWPTRALVRAGVVDLAGLLPDRTGLDPADDVLNGIAWDPQGRRLFVTTDRLSAFDRVIEGVPYKGQVLNQLAAWWFAAAAAAACATMPAPTFCTASILSKLPTRLMTASASFTARATLSGLRTSAAIN